MNNPLSYSSIRLDLFSKDGERLKPASGFVVEADGRHYIITNKHVLTGRDISAREPQESLATPYILKTSIHIHSGEGEHRFPVETGPWRRITVPLYNNDNAPTWIEHQVHDQRYPKVDLAALPINLVLTLRLFSGRIPGIITTGGEWAKETIYWSKISAIPASAVDTHVEYSPPDPVYVIGHPLGWAPNGTDKSSAAFWRTSAIASEMHVPGMNQANVFFIDPCAPEGMTGSPVIGMKNDRLKLLGVYSDQPTAEFGANAGLVWDARLVKELVRAS